MVGARQRFADLFGNQPDLVRSLFLIVADILDQHHEFVPPSLATVSISRTQDLMRTATSINNRSP